MVGIYGLLSYWVSVREHEIGIRFARASGRASSSVEHGIFRHDDLLRRHRFPQAGEDLAVKRWMLPPCG